ncbi:MAG: hypothetical protein IJZ88_05875 [Clostridia bacterium]|nr:hypothetical protein [Clostridia bacterium]MBQ8228526.1 hypothetical protein [Clostridia bacterium]
MAEKIIILAEIGKPYALTIKGETIPVRNLEALVIGKIKELPALIDGTVLVFGKDAKRYGMGINDKATNLVKSDVTEAIYGKAIWCRVANGHFCGFEESSTAELLKTLNKEDVQ